jgi:hypothetical protein
MYQVRKALQHYDLDFDWREALEMQAPQRAQHIASVGILTTRKTHLLFLSNSKSKTVHLYQGSREETCRSK